MRAVSVCLVFAGLLPSGLAAEAATAIGAVGKVQGVCEAVGVGGKRALLAGEPVRLDEEIATGAGARLA